MKAVRVIIVPVLLLVSAVSFAQSRVDEPRVVVQTGSTWKALTSNQKSTFILGFKDGYTAAVQMVGGLRAGEKAGEGSPVSMYDPTTLTVVQFRDGLDIFYSNLLNEKVPIAFAVGWVVMGANGTSNEEREVYAQTWRTVFTSKQ